MHGVFIGKQTSGEILHNANAKMLHLLTGTTTMHNKSRSWVIHVGYGAAAYIFKNYKGAGKAERISYELFHTFGRTQFSVNVFLLVCVGDSSTEEN